VTGGGTGGGVTGGGTGGGVTGGGGGSSCTNCTTGCCNGTSCLSGTLNIACGSNGNACTVCQTGTGCSNGQCLPCNASTCPNGCCDSQGQCQPGTSSQACGLGNGRACETCPLNTSCSARACVGNPPSGGLPAAGCTADTGCLTGDGLSTGEQGSCIPATGANPDGGAGTGFATGWLGGYCNPTCSAAGTCPAGTCVGIVGGNYCMGNCTGPGAGRGSCRTGYVCSGLTFGDGGASPWGVCSPDCRNAGAGCNPGSTCNSLGYCQ
jgi:hypothetical protein